MKRRSGYEEGDKRKGVVAGKERVELEGAAI